MNYKLKKTIGKQQIAKYYGTNKALAEARKTKNWELFSDPNEQPYKSRSFNDGELKTARFMVEIPGLNGIKCATEGDANTIMEKLGTVYEDVRVCPIDVPDVKPDDGGI